jgi:hypothetical protein
LISQKQIDTIRNQLKVPEEITDQFIREFVLYIEYCEQELLDTKIETQQ